LVKFSKRNSRKNNRTSTNLKDALSFLQNSSFNTSSDIDKISTTIKDIEDTLAESISIRVNPEHPNNSTIQMLHLTNLLNDKNLSQENYTTTVVDAL
jgi:hypothetical protein